LFRLDELNAGCGQFRQGAGFVRARAKLILHQRADSVGEDLLSLDVRTSRAHHLLRRGKPQKGVCRPGGDVEACELRSRNGAIDQRTGHIDRRASLSEIEGFPREQ
jgi:hypothetical protein